MYLCLFLQVSRRKTIKAKALFNTNRTLYRIEHVDIPKQAIPRRVIYPSCILFLFALYDLMARLKLNAGDIVFRNDTRLRFFESSVNDAVVVLM
jgi:hypothetical protein